jgi:hypothetical protein
MVHQFITTIASIASLLWKMIPRIASILWIVLTSFAYAAAVVIVVLWSTYIFSPWILAHVTTWLLRKTFGNPNITCKVCFIRLSPDYSLVTIGIHHVKIPNPPAGRALLMDKEKRVYPKFEGTNMLSVEEVEITFHLWNFFKHKDEDGCAVLHIPVIELSGLHVIFEKKPCAQNPDATWVGNWESLYEGYDADAPFEVPLEDTDPDGFRCYWHYILHKVLVERLTVRRVQLHVMEMLVEPKYMSKARSKYLGGKPIIIEHYDVLADQLHNSPAKSSKSDTKMSDTKMTVLDLSLRTAAIKIRDEHCPITRASKASAEKEEKNKHRHFKRWVLSSHTHQDSPDDFHDHTHDLKEPEFLDIVLNNFLRAIMPKIIVKNKKVWVCEAYLHSLLMHSYT